jgi:hypothetical protein
MWGNFISLGPVTLRVGSKHLAPWGFPRIQIGGLSLWSWSNSGQFVPASYHPRSSITWLWTVWIRREQYSFWFSKEARERMARLYAEGNPFAPRPRWFHPFVIPARVRRGQWTHYIRLPFGFVASVMCQHRLECR